jgi:hypothetical protein
VTKCRPHYTNRGGSKSNIPCCALLVLQVRATFASDSRIRRESGAYVTQMLRAIFAYDVRRVAHVSCQRCAHLPRNKYEYKCDPFTFGNFVHCL